MLVAERARRPNQNLILSNKFARRRLHCLDGPRSLALNSPTSCGSARERGQIKLENWKRCNWDYHWRVGWNTALLLVRRESDRRFTQSQQYTASLLKEIIKQLVVQMIQRILHKLYTQHFIDSCIPVFSAIKWSPYGFAFTFYTIIIIFDTLGYSRLVNLTSCCT